MKKKILTLVIALSLVLTSCSSDSNENQVYFIKTKVDGELLKYNFSANALLPINGNVNANQIQGRAKATQNTTNPSFSFEINDPAGIKVQNYSEENFNMIFKLKIDDDIIYHSQADDVNDFNINITEITNNHIKGTFSGTVTLTLSSGDGNFSLTEGEFFLKRNLN